MKKQVIFGFLLAVIFLSGACKSEFEAIRANPDPEVLYKKGFEYYEQKDYQKAQTLFELIVNGLRGKVEAEKVYYYYAYTHYHLQKYVSASYYFKNFATTFGNSPLKEEADFMAAYSNYKLSPIYRLDQSYSDKAIEGFQLFVNTYPNSERVKECNRLIDEMRQKMEEKAYHEGELYYQTRQYQSAMRVFENVLKDYPETKEGEKIRYLVVKSAYLLAENSVYEKQEERYTEVVKKSKEFLGKYASSSYKQEINSFLNDAQKGVKKFDNVRHKDQGTRAGS